jgi:phosphatidylserine/phosphatidylglycerophosphate/cardiolipin synthase-like enzyme
MLIIAACVVFSLLALVVKNLGIGIGGEDGVGGGIGGESGSAGGINDNGSILDAEFTYHLVPSEQLTLITEPDDGMTPILAAIKNASTSVDLVIYELQDQDVENALAAAAGRGVSVRVILNGGYYGAGSTINQPAFSYLQSHGVHVKWSPKYFALTHQKTLIIDGTTTYLMTFNFTPKYYKKSRDFGIEDSDPQDVSAIEKTFNADWNSTKEIPENGDDLIWSPGSEQVLLAMITSAHSTLLVSSEELTDVVIINALAAAAGRGVKVYVLMTDNKKWHSAFSQLKAAGVQVRVYAARAPLYIHEKIIIVDGIQAFVGSENLTSSSLEKNRELGLLISTPTIVQKIAEIFTSDWYGAVAPST